MLNFLSTVLNLGNEVDDIGVFDPLLDIDSNYFINIKRLKEAKTPEFEDAYEKINALFREIGLLLANSSERKHKLYKAALKRFDFPEVNGICLGYSNSKHGSGFGEYLREQIISDSKQIIDSGVKEPEIFHLVGLFEKNVGPDRISDMIACIVKSDIEIYTKRINKQLGINETNYPDFQFQNGLIINPFKNSPVLLLPKEVLHELPIAKDWEDIDRVCNEIEEIRREINEVIGKEWTKSSSSYKKEFLKDYIINNPEVFMKIIKKYRETSIPIYDFNNDPNGEYRVAKIANVLPNEYPIEIPEEGETTHKIAKLLCHKFKDLVENNKVNDLLYINGKPRSEKIVQRAFFCVADSYCSAFKLDISPETDSGRGPVDFKFSDSYLDRTLVEIKLTSNHNLVHGMKTQIQEYAKAEKTANLIYLVIHNGGPNKRIEELMKHYSENKEKKKCPLLILVDATPKESASKYEGE
ncbi:hypothetical protein [Salibacterium halotolerans]|uniref:Uncharacterized protein n=1 Tax=Salibacterium halotolerans TaxID=1884432 RepID=A0A1I5YC35_9BACI|nr:hypothetical protein [Salibacterium halotolerans]SFQ41756.1 hypothetical protein SAMN05518683_1401 [Salibacterium halotolerans]